LKLFRKYVFFRIVQKKMKKLFDSRVIFRHISPVFSRDKQNRFSSGSFFLQGLVFENWSVKKKRAGQ